VKVAILGAGGQLAHDLIPALAGHELSPFRHGDLDVLDAPRVREVLGALRPDAVINTAAFHRVDDCEAQWEKAFQVNAFAVRELARLCAEMDSTLVHISTDYVFGGGEKRTPYTEADAPYPLGVYGVSKLAGEYFVRTSCPKHFVVRSSGLYGVAGSSGKGGNFVETMIRLAKAGKPIRVVNDQVLAPTFTHDLADTIRAVLRTESYGLYHIANSGECSWYEFARTIFELAGLSPDFGPTTSAEYKMVARRPAYSVLGSEALPAAGITRPRHWREALAAYLGERNPA